MASAAKRNAVKTQSEQLTFNKPGPDGIVTNRPTANTFRHKSPNSLLQYKGTMVAVQHQEACWQLICPWPGSSSIQRGRQHGLYQGHYLPLVFTWLLRAPSPEDRFQALDCPRLFLCSPKEHITTISLSQQQTSTSGLFRTINASSLSSAGRWYRPCTGKAALKQREHRGSGSMYRRRRRSVAKYSGASTSMTSGINTACKWRNTQMWLWSELTQGRDAGKKKVWTFCAWFWDWRGHCLLR